MYNIFINGSKFKKLTYVTLQIFSIIQVRLKLFQFPTNLRTLQIRWVSIALLEVNRKKVSSYMKPDLPKIVQKADDLYKQQQYLQVYEFLIQYKNVNDTAVIWRICRALYQLSTSNQFSKEVHKEMLNEGLHLLEEGLIYDQANADLHKWSAILLNSKAAYENVLEKIKSARMIKKHLVYANILNPDDKSVLYLLGYLCYQMSSLSWFQRKLLIFLYDDPPECTFEEAFNYFLKADKLPPPSISNTFMLGKISLRMGQYFRASYYLRLAGNMQAFTENEKKIVAEATKLSKFLDKYDLSKDALIFLDESI